MQECGLSGKLKSTLGADESLQSTGLMCRNTEISEQSTGLELNDPTCSPAGSPANPRALPENERGEMTSDGCGPNLPEPFASYDHDTCSWRTCQGFLLPSEMEPQSESSSQLQLTMFSGTWPQAGMMRNGLVYRRRRLAPRISGRGSGLWPTPGASKAANDLKLTKSGDGRRKPNKLGWAISSGLYPTPTVADSRGTRNHTARRSGASSAHNDGWTLVDAIDGLPTPTFVEWLMGLPLGWTELDDDYKDSETP